MVDLRGCVGVPGLLLSLSADGRLRLWDAPSSACLASVQADATTAVRTWSTWLGLNGLGLKWGRGQTRHRAGRQRAAGGHGLRICGNTTGPVHPWLDALHPLRAPPGTAIRGPALRHHAAPFCLRLPPPPPTHTNTSQQPTQAPTPPSLLSWPCTSRPPPALLTRARMRPLPVTPTPAPPP